jgi:uncharacterized surface protein with fasciclin (FAS1) repeats
MLTKWNLGKLGALALAGALTLSLTPQADARGPFDRFERNNSDLVERLEQLGDFSILLTALDTAGLSGTVASAEALTVLAPTDEAFAALLAELGISAGELLASPDLDEILLYHVIPGKQRISQLGFQSVNPTLLEENSVIASRDGRQYLINDSLVLRANISASNGLIHVLDRVLLPPEGDAEIENIVDVLEQDGRFSILLTALDTAALTGALEGTGSTLTLFAPTDDAFAALLADLGISAGELLANPDLGSILLYHVAPGTQRGLQLLLSGGTETLLVGESVSVRFARGGLLVNSERIISPNISAPNGIIHVLDGVLLP